MNKMLAFILALAVLALAVLPAEAATPIGTPEATFTYTAIAAPPAEELTATEIVTGTPPITGSVRIAYLIAAYFGLTADEIVALRSQDMGWGSITKALFTAGQAGVPLEQILEMRRQGIGWGEIRQSLGLPAGMPHSSLGTIISKGHGPTKAVGRHRDRPRKRGRARSPEAVARVQLPPSETEFRRGGQRGRPYFSCGVSRFWAASIIGSHSGWAWAICPNTLCASQFRLT